MAFAFGRRSKAEMVGLHPDLRLILHYTISRTPIDFTVYDGGRTLAEQKQHVANGKSDTLESSHRVDQYGLHYAVDLVPLYPKGHPASGKGDWRPESYMPILRIAFEGAARYGVPLDWGGWWTGTSFGKDYAHLGLKKKWYPPNGAPSTVASRLSASIKWECDRKTGKFKTIRRGVRPVQNPA